MTERRLGRWLGVAAMLAGILWAAHGAFEMLQPLGSVTEYQDDRGYSIITDSRGFRVYGLPGPPALLLSAGVIMGAIRPQPPHRGHRVATWLTVVAAMLGLAAIVGVVIPFDPPFEAGMNFGRLLVSIAAIAAGTVLRRRDAAPRLGVLMSSAGWVGVFVLVARVMVNALDFLPRVAAFGVSVLLGLAWIAVGLQIFRATRG
jgi:hypothetical protein